MSLAASHTPRKKRRLVSALSSTDNEHLIVHDVSSNAAKPAFPLVAFVWPARGTTSRWIILPLILMTVGLFRWTIGLWGFSGYNKPPMHGDFEAQRHWMEITNHLPISLWYFYDLQYWGLDYPPLTAYHSWLCGKIGSLISPSWFALDKSRGSEDDLLKIFMRGTVIVSEYLIYVPAVVLFQRHMGRVNGSGTVASAVALVAILMQPATLIIDHGHFQYNTVMLGFVVAAVSCFFANHVAWGCVFFVAALGFKQMALYYSPLVFAYLLGSCISPRIRPGRLILIAVATIGSFAVLFGPLILGALYDLHRGALSIDTHLPQSPLLIELLTRLRFKIYPKSATYAVLIQLTQAIHRIFPFARGLFEDKVANVWCLLNHTILKLTVIQSYTSIPLSRLSLYCTLASIFPTCLLTFLFPRKSILLPALSTCAWGFFLFSFQVHEKSVLLPLLPMTLMLGSPSGLSPSHRAWIGFANLLGTFTCYPLLKRDELRIPYFVLTFLWSYLLALPPTSFSIYVPSKSTSQSGSHPNILTTLLHLSFYLLITAWHIADHLTTPPSSKPDLYVVINVVIGAIGFGLCYIWSSWQTVVGSGLMKSWFHEWKEEEGKRGQKERERSVTPGPASGATTLSSSSKGGKRGQTPVGTPRKGVGSGKGR